jgi:hypothetical protein
MLHVCFLKFHLFLSKLWAVFGCKACNTVLLPHLFYAVICQCLSFNPWRMLSLPRKPYFPNLSAERTILPQLSVSQEGIAPSLARCYRVLIWPPSSICFPQCKKALGQFFNTTHREFYKAKCLDETLSSINKLKHPKMGEYKEKNGTTHLQEDKSTT